MVAIFIAFMLACEPHFCSSVGYHLRDGFSLVGPSGRHWKTTDKIDISNSYPS